MGTERTQQCHANQSGQDTAIGDTHTHIHTFCKCTVSGLETSSPTQRGVWCVEFVPELCYDIIKICPIVAMCRIKFFSSRRLHQIHVRAVLEWATKQHSLRTEPETLV